MQSSLGGHVNVFAHLPNPRPVWHTHPCDAGEVLDYVSRRRGSRACPLQPPRSVINITDRRMDQSYTTSDRGGICCLRLHTIRKCRKDVKCELKSRTWRRLHKELGCLR